MPDETKNIYMLLFYKQATPGLSLKLVLMKRLSISVSYLRFRHFFIFMHKKIECLPSESCLGEIVKEREELENCA